jgi:importin subunit beta-1
MRVLTAALLIPHSQNILELVHRCLGDEERSDALMRLGYGLIGDLAECFAHGQLKQLFLAPWVAAELRSRSRMPEETKRTMRWAREVCDALSVLDLRLMFF